jgi:peptidoglycan/LPS O-acetylase OafA/YrhL
VTPTDTNLLAAHIERRENSLDLIRLISASLVILGHSYAIVGSGAEPMARWNGSVYSGLFALHVFFFISGLLVTNSFLHKPDIVRWMFSRILRIIPALCVCLILTTFVLGPLATTLPVRQYLTDHGTWDYFLGNLFLLNTRFLLPGVFAGNVDKAVNGPLWSLYLEVRSISARPFCCGHSEDAPGNGSPRRSA